MNKILHKIKLAFLHPFWRLRRLYNIASNKKVLDIILDLEDDVNEYRLKVIREENKDEIIKSNGMRWVINLLKEKLNA